MFIQMAHGCEDASKIPIDDMVIGPGHHIEAEVLEIVDHIRASSGPSPSTDWRRIYLKIVYEHLKICETDIKLL
mgnify:CR=1 FL=1